MDEPELEERLLELLRESIRQPDDVRRPVRRLPLGRRRLVDERRADVRADGRPGAHVLGRLRAVRALQRARARADDRAQVRHRPPRGRDRRARPGVVPPGADLPPGRADRRLGRACRSTTSRSSRATTGRSSSRSARARTSSSTATRATARSRASTAATGPRSGASRSRRRSGRDRSRVPDREARAARAGGRGGGRGTDPVLGRRDRVPGRAQGPRAHERPRASGLVRRRQALVGRGRATPTCCRR